jgi:hypothetical protein
MIREERELVHFTGSRRDLAPPTLNISGIGSDTPDVFALDLLVPMGTVHTITNFRRGSDAQTIRILGSADITIAHNANIKTNTGIAKVLTPDVIYSFTYYNGVWYEAAV